MKISEFYKKQKHTFSFEFFPPKTDEAEAKLFETAAQLKALKPSFVSVTYGAMGTTRSNTLRIVGRIKNEIGIEAAAHLTCVGNTRDEIAQVLKDLKSQGVENIVALRGDPPKGATEFKPVAGGFANANELVSFIRSQPEFAKHFALAVAGYPEGHIECPDKEKDFQNLKRKIEAGADAVITQLFFNNADYFTLVEKLKNAGVNIPVIAGIMPITNGAQIQRFASMCGAKIPREMETAISKLGDDQPSVEAYGIEYATKQCAELLKNGIPGIHFYTLNRSQATQAIYKNLGLDRL